MRYLHFCDCGPIFHCGKPIVHNICAECGDEYIGPDCNVARPLPVVASEDEAMLCNRCREKKLFKVSSIN